MFGSVVTFIVGVICIIIGISNMRGNISSIHSYHRSRVSEENRLPFGRGVGLGTIIIGIGILIFGILSLLTFIKENNVYISIGTVIMIVGIIVGLIISFATMIKYNKGIF